LRFGLICPKCFVAPGSELKSNQLAVNTREARSLHEGVVSAKFVCVKYSSTALDITDGSKKDKRDSDAIVTGKRLLLMMNLGLMTSTPLCLAQGSVSTYFRKVSGYWVV
jgi:hypothetical protein